MPDNYKRPYFDASLFIAWIKGEVVEGVERGSIVQHLVQMARRGDFEIITSTISLAEVHKSKGHVRLKPADDETILALFENEFFVFVDVDRNIGEEANRLCRTYGLNPCDAMHLASALRAGCDVLLTWDRDLLDIDHPDVRTEPPEMIGQLTMEAALSSQQ